MALVMSRAMEGDLVVVADTVEVVEEVDMVEVEEEATVSQCIRTRQDTPPHHPQATLLHTLPLPPPGVTLLHPPPPPHHQGATPLQGAILLPTPALDMSRSEVCQPR